MNGLFYIRNDTITYERNKIIHKFEACGDIGWAKEVQYMRLQSMIDGMVNNDHMD